MEWLSDVYKKTRESMHYSQEDMAELLGVGRVMISHYERGTHYPTWEALSFALQVPVFRKLFVSKLLANPPGKVKITLEQKKKS